MKLRLICTECAEKGITDSNLIVEPNDDGYFNTTCENGHKIELHIVYHTFQILFEIGENAIIDGYYREAINSFAASYERFLEFFIHLISRSNGINEDLIKYTWKQISRQSERQLGAYYLLFLLAFKEKPFTLTQNNAEFRNSIIHKGHIPNRKECLIYGQTILNFIHENLKKLWETHRDEVLKSSIHLEPEFKTRKRAHVYYWFTLPTNRDPGDKPPNLEEIILGKANYFNEIKAKKS